MTLRAAFACNEWARESVVRASTWRLAASVVRDMNPTAEASVRVMRSMMRQNALDAVQRARFAIKLEKAA